MFVGSIGFVGLIVSFEFIGITIFFSETGGKSEKRGKYELTPTRILEPFISISSALPSFRFPIFHTSYGL